MVLPTKTIKALCSVLVALSLAGSALGQTLNVSPVLCSDPATGVYIVSSSTDVIINIKDASGNYLAVNWSPVDFLYLGTNKQFPFPDTNPPTFYSGDVYFNSGIANHTYTYTATYSTSSGTQTQTITLVTDGFIYDDFCFGDTKTLADINLLSIPNANLNWYSDATGNTPIPNTTSLVEGTTYYVDLGYPGCSLVFPVAVEYGTPLPTGAVVQKYCSETTWLTVYPNWYTYYPNSQLKASLSNLNICGQNLTWYSSAAGPATLPLSTLLVDGMTYYVSQTINNCESGRLAVTVQERQCACFQNPYFEDTALSSYEFFYDSYATYGDCNVNATNATIPFTPGPASNPSANAALFTSGGFDPNLQQYDVLLPEASPYGDCSTYTLRLNNAEAQPNDYISVMKSEFIAGEVFAFDFALVLQNPSGHVNNQPYFNIRVFDKNNNIIQERCVLSDPDGCVFLDVKDVNPPGSTNPTQTILFSEWSCIKVNTAGIRGEAARVEFLISDCGQGAHYGYVYIDNIFVGDNADSTCNDSSFGFMSFDQVSSADGYEACSLVEPPTTNCSPLYAAVNPSWPIQICGVYDAPINTQGTVNLNSIVLDVKQYGNIVATLTSATSPNGPGTFCFTLNQSDLSVPPYGEFDLEGSANFVINCGASETLLVKALSNGFKFCPTAGCPLPLQFCTGANPPSTIDLTQASIVNAVLDGGNPLDFVITYYTNQTDALNGGTTGQINPPASYPFPSSSTTVYIRLDYDWTYLGIPPSPDCFDVVPLEIIIGNEPNVPATVPDLNGCVDGNNTGFFDLSVRYPDVTINIPNPPSATVIVTYHTSLQNAQVGTPSIQTPANFQATLPQTIYVRTENINDGCFKITTFNLLGTQLNYNPPTSPLVVCDMDTDTQDGSTSVDLSSVTAQISAGFSNLTITYYINQTDAQNGTGPTLPTPNYTTTDITVYVRIEVSGSPSCFAVELLTIDVVASPETFLHTVYKCDIGNDGAETFDLTNPAIQSAITGGAPGVTVVSYHATFADADNNVSAFPTPANYVSGNTVVYARLENANCHNVAAVPLFLISTPALPSPIPALTKCDIGGDGTEIFDLTLNGNAITANEPAPGDYTVTYFASLADLQNNSPVPDETAFTSTGPTHTIHVLVEGSNSCTTQATFDLIINPLPSFNPPSKRTVCDQGAQDGFSQFDLSLAEADIKTGFPGINVIFYEVLADAQAGTGPSIGPNYTNTVANNQTIYARIVDPATGCVATAPVDLEVVPAPAVNAPPPYELCDIGNDGTENFDLSTLDASITGVVGTVTVTYHPTLADAQNGTAAVNKTNYPSGTATVYARVEDNNPPNCHNTVVVNLVLLPTPGLPTNIQPINACDPNGDGQEVFDLTIRENDITINEPAPGDYTVVYYPGPPQTSTQIPDPTQYTNTSQTQTIYAVVTGSNGCTAQTSFDIVVNPLPNYNPPQPLIICDDGSANGIASFDLTAATTQITGNNPDLLVSYHETQADAQNGANPIGPTYTNTQPYNQTVYVRIEHINTGCVIVVPLDLQVNQAPPAFTPAPYIYCDHDNDGVGVFDLTTLDNEITGGAGGVVVTYHETYANAFNDVLDIANPTAFTNTVHVQQIIYARVEAPGVACFNIVSVTLLVVDSPQAVFPQNLPPLNGCDLNGDGIVFFNLTLMEPAIEANEPNPNDFTLTYYVTQADADAGINPISVPTAFANTSNPQTIYVVMTGLNGCTDQTNFQIVVNQLPQITTPQPLELCDVNNPGDEKEAFDLTLATLDVTLGDPSIIVTYHQTQAEADSGANPVQSPYVNQINNETLYIRAVDPDTGCLVTQGYTLTLIVNPLPSPEIPADPVVVCDADNNGFAEFDLVELIPIIRNGEQNVNITFHYTLSEAESGANPIDTSVPFALNTANNQILYVRAENSITGCYITGQLELEVAPTPEIVGLEDLYICDDDTPNGFAVFNLTLNTPKVIGAQDPTNLEVTYHISQQEAEAGINAVSMPALYMNISNPQTIYVRIENVQTGCYDTFDFAGDNSFELYVEELPIVNDPSPLKICDDDYGKVPVEQAVFDLTSKEGEITGQAFPPSDYEFVYYASQQDFQTGVPIQNPTNYQNVENPQEIWITVVNENTQNLCEDHTTLTLVVMPLPSPSETDQEVLRLKECDDDNDGIAANPFDLSISGNLIAGGENVVLSYYKTQVAVEIGDTTSSEYIINPKSYVNEPSYNEVNPQGMEVQVIYVRVESGVAGNPCFVIASFEIMVIPAPVLNDIDPFGYTLCEDGISGTATVYINDIAYNLYDASVPNPDPSVLVPLLDQTENTDLNLDNYDLIYSTDPLGTPPLPSGYTASTGDVIYVYVVNEETGCKSEIKPIEITVEPRPSITAINISVRACSDDPGGNTATIDLTVYDPQINPGAPAGTQVVYYANMDSYMNGDIIEDPSAYTTVKNPQTIIAVVKNTGNLCESADHAEITFEIEPSPLVDISGYSGVLCFDLDPNTPVEGGDYDSVLVETGLDESLYTFEWSRDGNPLSETGSSLVVDQPGTYEVVVTDDVTNCKSKSTATFTGGNPPEFDVSPLTLAFDEEHSLLISNVVGAGEYIFKVDDGPWKELGTDGRLIIGGLAPGTHFVYGKDLKGCGITIKTINFIDYPKFFTPNNDGYNDTWNIIGLGEANASAKIYIFDRYGKLLKQLSPRGPGWDGTYIGNPMPADDYWFRVEYYQKMPDGTYRPELFRSNFSLIR